MARPAELREPELSPIARRLLAALLFSAGLHAAIIGFLRFKPVPDAAAVASSVLQVRLTHPAAATAPKIAAKPTPLATIVKPATDPVSESVAAPPGVLAKPEPQAIVALPDKSNLAALATPLVVDNTYYTARQLDVLPQPVHPIVPAYPESAVAGNIEGWVILKLKIDAMGKVESVTVSAANPPGVFDQAAVAAFSKGQFTPAQKAGRVVKSLAEIKVRFELH